MGIGVALAGGGLKGVSHIGALAALEELGIQIDYITGTSSGAMVASFYAMGYTPDEMKEIIKQCYEDLVEIKKRVFVKAGAEFIFKRNLKLQGIIDGNKIEKIVADYARKKEIYKVSDIQRKFGIVTVDAKTTKKCIMASKQIKTKTDEECLYNIPIEKAVHASMAFPAIFTPCKYEQFCFIDGGTVDNLPVDVLKQLGAEKTISLSFNLDEFSGEENLFSIILRACDIFSMKDVTSGRDLSDIDIKIDIDQAKLLKIDNIDSSIKIGYDTVMKNKETILGMVETK